MEILEDDFSPDDMLICICGFEGVGKEMYEHFIIKHPNLLIKLILEEE